MLLLAVALLTGVVAGWLRPPLGARSARPHLRRVLLLGVGAAFTGFAQLASTDVAVLLTALALATLLGFALSNSHLTGIVVIGVGLFLNLVSVVANNGIPVRSDALVIAGVVEEDELATTELDGARHFEGVDDPLPVLGDVIPLPAAREVMSFGDLIVVAGAADALREVVRRRRRSWSVEDRDGYTSAMTQLRAVHDWGTAPSGSPVSGSQYSAKPDLSAPAVIDLTRSVDTAEASPLVEATHDK